MPTTPAPIPLQPINYNAQIQSIGNNNSSNSGGGYISDALNNGGSIFGGIANIIDSLKGNVTPAPINNYYSQDTKNSSLPTEYIIGGIVLISLIIGLALYLKK
jgi:hypothetical protein